MNSRVWVNHTIMVLKLSITHTAAMEAVKRRWFQVLPGGRHPILPLVLRTAVVLVSLFTTMMVVILPTPYDVSPLRTFLTSLEDCEGECLLGIRPGITTVGGAMAYLQSHTWIESIQMSAPGTGYGQIRWGWSGRQPDSIDEGHQGRITFYWDDDELNVPELNDIPVQTISIYTRIPMFFLQDWFGKPDSGTAGIRPDGALGYSAAYHRAGRTLTLSTNLPCPSPLTSYWNTWTRMAVSIGQGTSDYVSPLKLGRLC